LKKIQLFVRIKNEPAILFYQKLGFKILKESESYYPDGENAYLMEKEI
jgi:ribosomal protein S18 acetylase RimI-like enzyme